MGVTKEIDVFEKRIMEETERSFKGMRMCELGNQGHWRSPTLSAKRVYTELGVDHLSIDLNGRWDALPRDLDKPITDIGVFDVITNWGTIEHVNNQFQVFKTVHDACVVGGLMLHAFPQEGHFPGHCRYRYTWDFARGLAAACGYDIISLEKGNWMGDELAYLACEKKTDAEFVTEARFKEIPGLFDCGDKTNTGNYKR